MKSYRHAKILEIIQNNVVLTQEEILEFLKKENFNVTQATVSRDIKDLNIVKATDLNGIYRYMATNKKGAVVADINSLFSMSVVGVESTGNLVIIKTLGGMAQAICATLDDAKKEKVVGTLAGEATIFVAVHNETEAKELCEEFRQTANL